MTRKAKVVLEQQVYKLPQWGPHARVTIEYDADNPPLFFQPAPSTVIIGEHECAPQLFESAQRSGQFYPSPDGYQQPARGGNLLDESSPAYQQMRQSLRVVTNTAAKPVFTTEDAFREAGIKLDGPLDINSLATAAAASLPVEE